MIRYSAKAGVQILIILTMMGLAFGAGTASQAVKKKMVVHSGHYFTVSIKNMTYSPRTMTVSAGDTVEWLNADTVPHMVNSDSGAEIQSPLFNQEKSYVHVFTTPGKYTYHCAVHPTMLGTIIVK